MTNSLATYAYVVATYTDVAACVNFCFVQLIVYLHSSLHMKYVATLSISVWQLYTIFLELFSFIFFWNYFKYLFWNYCYTPFVLSNNLTLKRQLEKWHCKLLILGREQLDIADYMIILINFSLFVPATYGAPLCKCSSNFMHMH